MQFGKIAVATLGALSTVHGAPSSTENSLSLHTGTAKMSAPTGLPKAAEADMKLFGGSTTTVTRTTTGTVYGATKTVEAGSLGATSLHSKKELVGVGVGAGVGGLLIGGAGGAVGAMLMRRL